MMYRYLFLLFIFSGSFNLEAQSITASELLDNAMVFHDPDNLWGSYTGKLRIVSSRPGKEDRESIITIDQERSTFKIRVNEDGVQRTYEIRGASCDLTYEGKREFSQQVAEQYQLSCDRARTLRDYYSYLYGLPMKLKDNGVHLDTEVKKRVFKGKDYLVLKATYDESIGKDTWYFYFDPETYAMEAYQFFHDESIGDGEYILLSEMENVSTMKLPKVRAWYTNKEEKYLGTDTLIHSESIE